MLRGCEEVLHEERLDEEEKCVETEPPLQPIPVKKLAKMLFCDKDFYNYADYIDIACLCFHKMSIMSRLPQRIKLKLLHQQINEWSGLCPKKGAKFITIEQFYRKVGS